MLDEQSDDGAWGGRAHSGLMGVVDAQDEIGRDGRDHLVSISMGHAERMDSRASFASLA